METRLLCNAELGSSGLQTLEFNSPQFNSPEERIETSLAEMMVGGERVLQSELFHQNEADAISERPLFVVVAAEEIGGRLETI